MIRLNFNVLEDGILEARVPNGCYAIFPTNNSCFAVNGHVNDTTIEVGNLPNLYEALDAANVHYNRRLLLEIQEQDAARS